MPRQLGPMGGGGPSLSQKARVPFTQMFQLRLPFEKGAPFPTFFSSFFGCEILITMHSLTLKWPRYFYSRWCPRGFHGTPLRKPLSHRNFAMKFAPYMYRTWKITILQKTFFNVVPFQNGGQITDFCFASFRFWPNFEKPLSQRNFSMKFGSKKENINGFTLLK